MSKSEFLNILRETLNQEVTPAVIEQNIRYYDQYINSTSKAEEEQRIKELGDPRLIAKTIIEAEKAAREKNGFHGYQNSYDKGSSSQQKQETPDWEQRWEQQNSGFQPKLFFANLKWYHKLIAVLVVILIVVILLFVSRVLIGALITFAPILILLLLLGNLFRRRR